MTKPCYKCPDRHSRCWSDCERYAAMKAEIEAQKQERYKGRGATNFLIDNCQKTQRRLNRK